MKREREREREGWWRRESARIRERTIWSEKYTTREQEQEYKMYISGVFLFFQDGHLRSGDHMFQIGDINVRGMSSEMVATVLRQCGSQVRLIVARGISEPTPEMQVSNLDGLVLFT